MGKMALLMKAALPKRHVIIILRIITKFVLIINQSHYGIGSMILTFSVLANTLYHGLEHLFLLDF